METGLRGRRALVTAASKGLGRAVAAALLSEGCRVAISSSDELRIQATRAELAVDPGGELIAMAADVAQADECEALVEWASRELGGLDVLVTNTGGPPPGTFEGFDEAVWRHAFDSILMSAIRLSRYALPYLREGGHGAIVCITSMAGKEPIDGLVLSNALRPAVTGMAKTLSREAGPAVRVNCVAPEAILTDRIRQVYGARGVAEGLSVDQVLERAAAGFPLRRFGSPEELARAVVFLAGDAASFITGQTIVVDGGTSRGLF